ncbi:hypothetical protein FEQ05_04119 [Burkholderia pseudomultivorans]|uniref:Uncharacterized protein n=1 Tax=Burkholderia pseudomultivorans TaxID=1207504 RepID=A0ABU2E9Y3_9BURK|nr:hypothetical protein [Burkholderia cenocepacia]MDR8730531.1 hypothetical protein [Burkholderia pseudomultivorans]TCT26530.1 hypothetical protein EC918_12313 [Burkholderia vietnamiensis]MBR8428404.1 hypothetical protein [Burkholderia cenocepacia]MDR8738448.1 hypothetical protein [Burkholderia pseudomultivorans]MDR8744861.1 hypothetical protein [Burkholderia pseudomultivorans]
MTNRFPPLDRRSKAFKGKGETTVSLPVAQVAGRSAFRVLLRSYESWLDDTVAQMQALAHESSEAGLDASLRCARIALASGATRHRLDWFLRGEPHAVPYARVQSGFGRMPAPLRAYLQQCDARSRDLNALESVFRYAASQIATYLTHGTVKIRRRED